MECFRKLVHHKKFPVKLTDDKQVHRVGVAVSSLSDLRKKANKIFNLTDDDDCKNLCVCLSDGTEVCDDDYLATQSNTLFVVSLPGRIPKQSKSGIRIKPQMLSHVFF